MKPSTEPTSWTLWSRRFCTVALWACAIGVPVVVFFFLPLLWLPTLEAVRSSDFRMKFDLRPFTDRTLQMADVVSLEGFRALIMAMLLLILPIGALAVAFFMRLRRLLDGVLSGHPFDPQVARGLSYLGTLSLGVAIAIPAVETLLAWVAHAAFATEWAWQLVPDVPTLFIGLLLKVLAELFTRASELQADADSTV